MMQPEIDFVNWFECTIFVFECTCTKKETVSFIYALPSSDGRRRTVPCNSLASMWARGKILLRHHIAQLRAINRISRYSNSVSNDDHRDTAICNCIHSGEYACLCPYLYYILQKVSIYRYELFCLYYILKIYWIHKTLQILSLIRSDQNK
jgi:hypothetical protein